MLLSSVHVANIQASKYALWQLGLEASYTGPVLQLINKDTIDQPDDVFLQCTQHFLGVQPSIFSCPALCILG